MDGVKSNCDVRARRCKMPWLGVGDWQSALAAMTELWWDHQTQRPIRRLCTQRLARRNHLVGQNRGRTVRRTPRPCPPASRRTSASAHRRAACLAPCGRLRPSAQLPSCATGPQARSRRPTQQRPFGDRRVSPAAGRWMRGQMREVLAQVRRWMCGESTSLDRRWQVHEDASGLV